MIANTFKNKKIIITGHTGFKGSWLAVWLNYLGAKVVGISRDIPTNPSLFQELSLSSRLKITSLILLILISLKLFMKKSQIIFFTLQHKQLSLNHTLIPLILLNQMLLEP